MYKIGLLLPITQYQRPKPTPHPPIPYICAVPLSETTKELNNEHALL
uniref:Uncharacterized protein n=1 Tax=Anguilla anguilla TaxID=7936 RepID=A0A0E9WNM3_ANGAN